VSTLLGIDLGTSAIKLLVRHSDGRVEKSRAAYESITPEGWLSALVRAAKALDLTKVDAVGLSSQVGTFIVDRTHVVPWNGSAGLTELTRIKSEFTRDEFIANIGMAHPDMVSYPIPRLMHFAKAFPGFREVCMPKELLAEYLTGEYVSDMYSWRGLADLENCRYSPFFMDYLRKNCGDFALPPLIPHAAMAGRITAAAARGLGLREGTPVCTGCNDFFAALIGAGVRREGDMFDITGTSEHLGGIGEKLLDDANLISGRYFRGFVRYGVTASSGPSLDYALSLHPGPLDSDAIHRESAPVFLPYVNGERCPVCDPMARGVMFGIGPGCTHEQMAYSVMEGVCFNLRMISEKLDMPSAPVIACGGAAKNPMLNQLKADILGRTILAIDEPDASALGAAYIAGMGSGEFSSIEHLPAPGVIAEYTPSSAYDFSRRYNTFRNLYPALKNTFPLLHP